MMRLRSSRYRGFTLIEMLVSTAVLVLLVALLSQLIGGLRSVISRTSTSIEQFQQARNAFETVSRRLSQATLNAYDDVNPTVAFSSTNSYVRASELRFISGNASTLLTSGTNSTHAMFFQVPLGVVSSGSTSAGYAPLVQLLNTVGYYVQWGSDQSFRPAFIPSSTIPYRNRFRLMEMIEPSDSLTVYKYTSGLAASGSGSKSWYYNTKEWFQTPMSNNYVHPIADNIIFLCVLPMVAPQNAQNPVNGEADGTSTDLVGTTSYLYDSSVNDTSTSGVTTTSLNQLPAMVFVEMIAVDDQSFGRFQGSSTADPSTKLGVPLTSSSYLSTPTYVARSGTNGDISTLTTALMNNHINYRVFSGAVPLSRN